MATQEITGLQLLNDSVFFSKTQNKTQSASEDGLAQVMWQGQSAFLALLFCESSLLSFL